MALAPCEPRGAALEPDVYPLDALPRGACTTDGERCALRVGYACAAGGVGRVDNAQCTCRDASWTCAVTSAGSSNCRSSPADASME